MTVAIFTSTGILVRPVFRCRRMQPRTTHHSEGWNERMANSEGEVFRSNFCLSELECELLFILPIPVANFWQMMGNHREYRE